MLSYLLLRLLPQWWPRSGCTLCIVHCTLTLTRRQPQVLVLFRLHKWYFVPTDTVCTSLATTSKAFFALDFTSKSSTLSFQLCSFCWKSAKATTALNFEHLTRWLIFSVLFSAVFDPGLTSNRARIFVSSYFNPIHCYYFLCVTFRPTFWFFVFQPCHV